MARAKQKSVLFLGTGNAQRSRFAEALFDSVAGKLGLPWKARSRGLAVARAGHEKRLAGTLLEELKKRGIHRVAEGAPQQVTAEDLESADLIVALNEPEHRPLLGELFPTWADRAEYWDVAEGAWPRAEREVLAVVARLIGGGARLPADEVASEVAEEKPCPKCNRPAKDCTRREPAGPKAVVRVGRETKGRRGKGVTTVYDLPLDEAGVQELAARLKQLCGTGGTVKAGRIEVQGDHRDRLVAELERMGYRAKRTGG